MTNKTIDLDNHRGVMAQKATDLRRLLSDVTVNQGALRLRQNELEAQLMAARRKLGRRCREGALFVEPLRSLTGSGGSTQTKAYRCGPGGLRPALSRVVGSSTPKIWLDCNNESRRMLMNRLTREEARRYRREHRPDPTLLTGC